MDESQALLLRKCSNLTNMFQTESWLWRMSAARFLECSHGYAYGWPWPFTVNSVIFLQKIPCLYMVSLRWSPKLDEPTLFVEKQSAAHSDSTKNNSSNCQKSCLENESQTLFTHHDPHYFNQAGTIGPNEREPPFRKRWHVVCKTWWYRPEAGNSFLPWIMA